MGNRYFFELWGRSVIRPFAAALRWAITLAE